MQGYNDDLVMSYSIALWIRDTSLRVLKERKEQQWAMMNTFVDNNNNKKETTGYEQGNPNHPKKNPYEMDVGKDKEDLSWLLG